MPENSLSQSESQLIVRWLREQKGVAEALFHLRYFWKMSIDKVITHLKKNKIFVSEQEILIALREKSE